jgi:hypothetical protein
MRLSMDCSGGIGMWEPKVLPFGKSVVERGLFAVILICGTGLAALWGFQPTESFDFGVRPARAADSTCPNWLTNINCVTDGDVREEILAPTKYHYVSTTDWQWHSASPAPEWLGERWLSCFDLLERAPWLQDKFDMVYPAGYKISDYAIALGTTTKSYYIELVVSPADVRDSILCVSYPAQGEISTAGMIDVVWEE